MEILAGIAIIAILIALYRRWFIRVKFRSMVLEEFQKNMKEE